MSKVLDLGLSLFDAVRTIKFLRACHGHSTLILCRHIGKPFKRNSTGDNIVGSVYPTPDLFPTLTP
ncbi:hypothetical protein B0H11DRAFT_2257310 [Mycena galericulata]|nr:hypothetical protein B0H11DRAFT_2257310 [Mycena galericulata]